MGRELLMIEMYTHVRKAGTMQLQTFLILRLSYLDIYVLMCPGT